MIRLLWRTDVHLSDFTPRSRTDNWTETVLDKLRQVGEIAMERGVDVVLDGGDFFDIKSPNRNSHSLVRQTVEIHRDYPCPVYANVGNHDCVYGDYKYLPQQPLGVLFATGVFQECFDDKELFISQGGVNVRVVGIPYHGTSYDLDRFRNIVRGPEDYLVVMAHLLASDQGGSMFESEDIVSYEFLKELPVDVFFFGHWHKDQGIRELKPKQYVVNVGSLTRGSLSLDDVDREPCTVLTTFRPTGIEIERIPLEYKPAPEIFDISDKMEKESRARELETFIDRLRASMQTRNQTSLRDMLISMPDLDSSVRELALHYLERAENDI